MENLQLRKLAHVPPEPKQHPSNIARQYITVLPENMSDDLKELENNRELEVFKGVCKLAALELAAQPFIRNQMKKHVYSNYKLSTEPTE